MSPATTTRSTPAWSPWAPSTAASASTSSPTRWCWRARCARSHARPWRPSRAICSASSATLRPLLGPRANVTKYSHMTPPLINDNEELNKIAQDAVVKLYGEDALGHLPTMMGSEDYAFFMEKVPGIYCFLGSRDAGAPLHQPPREIRRPRGRAETRRGDVRPVRFRFSRGERLSSRTRAVGLPAGLKR